MRSYQDMTGLSALTLGVAQGLMYNSAAGPNSCFTAVESGLIASSNLFYVLTKSFIPWYVPEVQLVLQDNVALVAGYYKDCEINKFFDTMTTLISSEGLSTLGARAAGAYYFEYKNFTKTWSDDDATTFDKGSSFGSLFGALTNYHI
jgi:hypothetical protein